MLPILWLAAALLGAQLDLLPQEREELAGRPATEAFLKERSERLIAQWRSDPDKADRKQALLLYWYRGPLLSEDDREFLKSLNPTEFGKVPEDKTKGKPGVVSGKAAGTASAPDELLARLKTQVTLFDDGDKAKAAALELAAQRMLESPTARQLAEELLAENRKVVVRFGRVPNSAVVERDGRKILSASGGNIDTHLATMIVTLNEDYLKTDPAYINENLPRTLGHELLGHGLVNMQAQRLGLSRTFDHYYNDEAAAGLVGWIIVAERGMTPNDMNMTRLLQDPGGYHDHLKVSQPYYAGTFSPAEMSNIVPVLEARLKAMDKEKERIRGEEIENYEGWRAVAEHFISAHKLVRTAFKTVFGVIDSQVNVVGPNDLKDADAVVAHIKQLIAYYKSPAGQAEAVQMQADSKKHFFTQQERIVTQRRQHLSKLLAAKPRMMPPLVIIGRSPSSAKKPPAPPSPTVYTWDEFIKLYEKDSAENPGHYGSTP